MVISKAAVLVAAVLVVTTTTVQGDTTMVGRGVRLSNYNVLGTLIQSGAQIFASTPQKCLSSTPLYTSEYKFSYYQDTKTFYKSVGNTAGISASLQSDFTLGFTLDMSSGSISGSSRKVAGNSLQIFATTSQDNLAVSCLYDQPLYSELLNDLAALPATVGDPWQSSSWQPYESFMNKHGSHVISGITYGSSINQMSFASSSKDYSEKDFEVNSCVALMGPTEGGMASVSTCAGVTQDEINTSSQFSMAINLAANGGTPNTRNQVTTGPRTSDLITQFLNEANETHAPIYYSFVPIWEIIQGHQDTSNDVVARSINLEQYYTGYQTYGCQYQTAGGQELQKFDLSSEATPTSPRYECSLASSGCHNDGDCHYFDVKCKCEWGSCVRYYDQTRDDGTTKQTAQINEANKWFWQGCSWKVWGSKCQCSRGPDTRTVVWSGDNKAAMSISRYNVGLKQARKMSGQKQEL